MYISDKVRQCYDLDFKPEYVVPNTIPYFVIICHFSFAIE